MAVEQRARRRPLSRQEQLALQERKQLRQEKMEESRELARGPIDVTFCLLVLLLTAIGLVMLLSASFPSAYYEASPSKHNPLYYFERQAIFAVLGTAVMLLVSKFNYQRLRGVGKILLYISVVLLLLVLIPGIGEIRNGARRWIGMGPLTFQPSEIAKAAIVVYFANSISRKKDQMRTFRYGVLPYAILLVLVAGLVAKEPHLSGAILILCAGAVVMLVGGINWGWVIAALGAAVGMVYVALFVIGYNTSRVTYWLNPWAEDPMDKGYQLRQSLITIGSGGLWGLGLGKSRQKFLFLPEEHNDFIFSVVCEELGLVGAGVVMLLFAALVLRGYWIALHCRDRFGALLVVGFTTLIAVQVFLNIAVVSGILPTTGIPLPFFSYGGTALCVQLAEMGIILGVSRQMKPTKAG